MIVLLELLLSGRAAHLPPVPSVAHRPSPGVDDDDDEEEEERPIGDQDDDEGGDDEDDDEDEEPLRV